MTLRQCLSAASRAGAVVAAAALLGGCAHAPRFKDQAPVWRVDDAHAIAEPEENEYLKLQYFADVFALRRLDRALELRDHEPAHNTNSLDEVPESTWFQNRIGRGEVSVEQIRRGAGATRPSRH